LLSPGPSLPVSWVQSCIPYFLPAKMLKYRK
jgi:hypothetical protein